jgi:hypothetical protein
VIAAVLVTPFVPEIVTVTVLETTWVVTVNVAVVFPEATVTVLGTVAAVVLLLDNVTVAPTDGAGPLRVTVAVEFCDPPFTVVGLSVSEFRVGAVTVSTAVLATPRVAVMVTEAFDATALVVIVKVVVVAFGGTVTLAGTCAAAVLLLESVTTAPAAGAGPFRVIVPVDEVLPTTDDGLRVSVFMAGVFTVKVPEAVLL